MAEKRLHFTEVRIAGLGSVFGIQVTITLLPARGMSTNQSVVRSWLQRIAGVFVISALS
jgi:hypothetical protein